MFDNLLKKKQKIDKCKNVDSNLVVDNNEDTNAKELEDSISEIVNSNNSSEFQLDNFLELFFRTDKYFVLEVIKPLENKKHYIEIIDNNLSAIIFTTKKKVQEYIDTELKSIQNGKDGDIVIVERTPEDVFEYIRELKENNVDRLLFNYHSEWISFNIK